jgi:hypothetical protein
MPEKTMFGDFFLIEQDDGPSKRVERLAFGETSGRDEAWLRNTLFDHPELLPVRDIDSSFDPLIPLCKELQTEAGPLDLAFINPNGRLTLVECKLWRNPQARREVVAQVLDYARAISRWSYSDLQRQVTRARGGEGNVPFELTRKDHPSVNEQQFVDAASIAMRSGRFLLLIAGDGIREDVGAIAELINRNAAAGFAFGLVEVALYGFENPKEGLALPSTLIIQPRIVARTQIIERTVVAVRDSKVPEIVSFDEEASGESGPAVESVAAKNKLGESPKQAEYRAWWEPVLQTKFDDPDQEPAKLYWPNYVRVALPWPNVWLIAYRVGGDGGDVGVAVSGRSQDYQEMIKTLAPQRDEVLSELPKGSEFHKLWKSDDFTFEVSRKPKEFANDDEKRRWLSTTMNAYVNVLRPRLKQLVQSR